MYMYIYVCMHIHLYIYNTHYIPIIHVVVGCYTVSKECNLLVPVCLKKRKQ